MPGQTGRLDPRASVSPAYQSDPIVARRADCPALRGMGGVPAGWDCRSVKRLRARSCDKRWLQMWVRFRTGSRGSTTISRRG